MLETVDLFPRLSNAAYKRARHFQRERLYSVAKLAFDTKVPVIILFEGWDAAGKGTTIRELTRRIDPRGFKVYPIQAPRTHELSMPWLWRFWLKIPARGQIAIFDRSWYGRVTIERVEGLVPLHDWIRAYEEINEFERTLVDDGVVFIKCWLHISREEQLRRFIEITHSPDRAWQVAAEDWERHRKYDAYHAAVEDMLSNTNTQYAPWTIISATDMNYRIYSVYKNIITSLEQALGINPSEWLPIDEWEAIVAEGKKSRGVPPVVEGFDALGLADPMSGEDDDSDDEE